MATRVIVSLVLLPVGIFVIWLGGWIFAGALVLVMGLAASEYAQLFRSGGLQPAPILLIAGTALLVLGRAFDGFNSVPWLVSLVVLAVMTYHLIAYERGRDQAATDFAVTLSGIFYIGWLGAYLVSLRDLPDGLWWVLTVLPAVWLADSGAYLFGRQFGRHKMTVRLSPNKSWEGYVSGILVAILGTALLAALWQAWAGRPLAVTPWKGAIVGLVMAVFPTLGDLGESMVKRQVGVKDSGKLLPGHGGAFDRIDSWLWAAALGYYLIVWFF